MKTITEYQPLIFGELFGQAQKRRGRRRSTWKAAVVVLPVLYVLAGVKISADTGLMVWDPRFWLIFVPLFLLGERLLWALSIEAGGLKESERRESRTLPGSLAYIEPQAEPAGGAGDRTQAVAQT